MPDDPDTTASAPGAASTEPSGDGDDRSLEDRSPGEPSSGDGPGETTGERAAAREGRVTRGTERPPGRPARQVMPSLGGDSTFFTVDRVVRFVLGAAGLTLAGWLLWYFAGLVLYLAVGGIFAYLLRPIVDRLQGVGLGRVPAILVTFVLVFTVVGFVGTSVLPFLAQQVQELSQLVSVDAAVNVASYIEERMRDGRVPIEEGALVENVRQVAQNLVRGDLVEGDRVAETVSSVVAVFTNIVYAVVIIPFITFFLLKDGVQIRRSLLSLVPNRYFEITLAILDKVEANIGRYFQALLVQCTSIAVIASILLWVVGLQNALAIGIFTGLANTIPYFGPFLGFIGGGLVGVAQTGTLSLVPGVAVAMALTQLADNVLLQPLIFSRAAQAHPLVILFVVLVGAQLAGIVGMLVAIPLATTVRVVIEQVLWSLRNYRILRSG
jgi:predicted PurR-regulated permease PerM